MTHWHPISTAPRDRRIWTASKCGKVFVTAWDKNRGQFAGYTKTETPWGWQEFVVPAHPGKEVK